MDLGVWRSRVAQYRVATLSAPGAVEANAALATVSPPAPLDAVDTTIARAGLTAEAREQLGARLLESTLDELIKSGVAITEVGLGAVCGPLESFFAKGLEAATRPAGEALFPLADFKELLVAVLEDRFDDYRFRRGLDDPMIACLTPAQRELWMKPFGITSVWLDADSEVIFRQRTHEVAQLATTTLKVLEGVFGTIDQSRAKHEAVVRLLRDADKNGPDRQTKVEEAKQRAHELQLLLNLSELTKAEHGADPARLQELKTWFRRFETNYQATYLAPLQEVLEMSDLKYTSGETREDPPASQRFALSAIACLQWPDAVALAECTDPNKHMLYAASDKYGIVQGSLRIVERYDGAKKKKPMLLLERLYPDHALTEKKQLIEHALERARQLGMPLALPEEYFWECEQFTRAGINTEGVFVNSVTIPSMREAIQDLATKKDAHLLSGKILRVKAAMGPWGVEYIDSAPLGGAADRGKAQDRRYHQADTYYTNQFVALLPRRNLTEQS